MIEGEGFSHLAINFQRPRIGFQTARIGGGIGFIQPEFVEVVIARDFIFWRESF
jgi:hypothetical protein